MPYVDLAGLSRYASRQKDRLERNYALLRDMQWLRTDKAGAVSLWPVGGTPLKPTVDFLFSETPPVSGDKSPSNPSTITGVSSITVRRYNKNIFGAYVSRCEGQTVTVNNVDFTYYTDGSILINGTANALTQRFLNGSAVPDSIFILRKGDTYTLSGFPSGSSDYPRLFFRCNNNTYYYISSLHPTRTITISKDETPGIWIEITNGTTVDNLLIHPQLELGSTATAFEPSVMDVYTLSLGNTYYGGTLDVALGVMTVDWEYVSIDRFYNCYVNSNTIRFSYNTNFDTTGYVYGQDPVGACNRFDVVPGGDTEFARQTGNPREMFVAINKSRLDVSGAVDPSNPTNSEWLAAGNAWLAEHPVVFIAKRAIPYTVQLDPVSISALAQTDKYTPRLNTVYTDASAVQVGYVKSPIRDEYELQQAVTAQGGNV